MADQATSQATNPVLGQLPQSQALAEASPDSLSELLSRDPFGLTAKADRVKITTWLREQAAKFAKAEEEGRKAPKPKAEGKGQTKTQLSLDELGL